MSSASKPGSFCHQVCRTTIHTFQHRAERRCFGEDGITGVDRQFVVELHLSI